MNIFQKQLIIDGKSLAELPNLEGYVWENEITPPSKVSIEEFENSMGKHKYSNRGQNENNRRTKRSSSKT